MNSWQIALLVFSIALLVVAGVNMYFDTLFYGWAIYISWTYNCLCLVPSILVIIALARNLGLKLYKTSLVLLYICDTLALVVFILFFISGFFNYIKILSISTLTSFAVVLQLFVNRFSVLNSYPPNVPQQEYQQVIYQQPQYQPGYMPNVQPSNYQPGYIPTASPNYQPPQYQPGNQFNAPPINNQQPQYKPGYEPTSQPSDNLQPQNQPGYEPIAPSSNDQSLCQPGNEPNAPSS